jgi:hypothetical protein
MAKKNQTIELEGEPISPTNYEAKYNRIVEELQASVFDGINPDDCWDISYDKIGNEIRKKRATKKNELKPVLTPSMVDFKLQSLLRQTMPLGDDQIFDLPQETYLDAFRWYFELMYFISGYITLTPSKQGYCAFVGITVAQYNELLGDLHFSSVFNSIEDGLLQNSFVAGESGLVESKTLAARITAKGVGHNVRKAEDTVIYNQTVQITTEQMLAEMEEHMKLTGGK